MLYVQNPPHLYSINCSESMYPTVLTVLRKNHSLGSGFGTLYGYVSTGEIKINRNGEIFQLREKSYFCLPGKAFFSMANAYVIVIERIGFRGMPVFGLTEKNCRLTYIDGCSDSMLVYPPRLGDPVLNHLHFPKGVVQSAHVHPSIRLGIVIDGFGVSVVGKRKIKLRKGGIFLLNPQELHYFATSSNSMDVIAYHPDSDWGPTDENHPMVNRTYISKKK